MPGDTAGVGGQGLPGTMAESPAVTGDAKGWVHVEE